LRHSTHDSRPNETMIPMGATASVAGTRDGLHKTASQACSLAGKTLGGTSVGSVRSEPKERQAIPWWLWWNLLSLDAPTVSIVWALLFASAQGRRLSLPDEIVLGLTVWAIYTGDRLLDGWTAQNREALQRRHFFCALHRTPLTCLIGLAAATSLWLTAEYLAPREAIAGIILGVMVGAYMFAIHAGGRWIEGIASKEVVVGVLFATGTTLPVWSQGGGFSSDAWASLDLFALICFLNCLSIECWENGHSGDPCHEMPRHLRWTASHINFVAAGLATSSIAILFWFFPKASSRPELFGTFLAALLILVLNRSRRKLSPETLRVLADAALVVPALIALLIRK
jgi:hypothetical protein